MMRIGQTVLALEEPLGEALARVERASDEVLPDEEPLALAPAPPSIAPAGPPADPGWVAALHDGTVLAPSRAPARRRRLLSATDLVVVATALGVLAASIAGLVWLLRG